MRPIHILVSHNHDTTVAELLQLGILLTVGKTENLLNLVEFSIGILLGHCHVLYVQQLTPQRENSVAFTAHNLQT